MSIVYAFLAAYAVLWAYMAGAWGILIGVMIMAAMFYVVPRLTTAFLIFVCFIPHLGEPEISQILTRLWIPPFILLATAWVVAVIVTPQKVHVDPVLLPLFLLFMLACVVSLTTGVDMSACPAALREAGDPWRRTREAMLASSLLIFATSACHSRSQLKRFFWVVVLSGIPLGISLFFFGAEVESNGIIARHKGFYLAVHPAALHMLLCTIAATVLLRLTDSRRRRLFLSAAILLFLATNHMTNARTVQAALPVVLLCGIAMEFGMRVALFSAIGLAAALACSLPLLPDILRSNVVTVFSAVFGNAEMTMQHFADGGARLFTFLARIEHIRVGLDLARQYPLFGVGLGRHTWAVIVQHGPQIHNYYIVMLAETGIVGFGLYMLMLIYSLILGGRRLRDSRAANDPVAFHLTQGLLLSMVAVMIVFVMTPGNATGERYAWPLMGLLAVRLGCSSRNRGAGDTTPGDDGTATCSEGGT